MGKIKGLGIALVVGCLFSGEITVAAQKLDATVLYRQNSDTGYSALIPGYSDPASPDCAADTTNVECSSPSQHTANAAYNVTGTTLSLLLPDGKIAVVNCVNKYSSRGTYLVRRNCAMPLVEHVQAEFKGNNAKLEWAFHPDGTALASEKYKIVAVLDKR